MDINIVTGMSHFLDFQLPIKANLFKRAYDLYI